jgi:hypothetical protein
MFRSAPGTLRHPVRSLVQGIDETPLQPAARIWKGPAMRLNDTQLKQTLNQMEAEVLPDTHPAAAQLTDLFGDHTFFLDQSGLKVLEPSEMSADEVQTSQVVSLADWSDATLSSLKPHAPEPTGKVVIFNQMKH